MSYAAGFARQTLGDAIKYNGEPIPTHLWRNEPTELPNTVPEFLCFFPWNFANQMFLLANREYMAQVPDPDEILELEAAQEQYYQDVDASSFEDVADDQCPFEKGEVLPAVFKPRISQQEHLQSIELLQIWHKFCTKFDIPYTLAQGTLLGQQRNFGPVGWDDDADLGVSANEEPKLLAIAVAQALLAATDGKGTNVCNLNEHIQRDCQAASYLLTNKVGLIAWEQTALNFKISVRGENRQKTGGMPYGFPYADVHLFWGWHANSTDMSRPPESFNILSRHWGHRFKREYLFPLRKVPYGGVALWSFNLGHLFIRDYYARGFTHCKGHYSRSHKDQEYVYWTYQQDHFG